MLTTSPDPLLRAVTDDGAFRVIVVDSTATVAEALKAQSATGEVARTFGDLITTAVLYRETMAPTLRVQALLRGSESSGRLVADSHPSGDTRGLVQIKDGVEFRLGAGAILNMMRTLPSGRVHQGMVEVPSEGGISQAFMAYLQTSEQVSSMTAVGTVIEGGEVKRAGGYMVQLLPEVGRGPLMVMAERLEDFRAIEPHLTPSYEVRDFLGELLHGMPFTEVGTGGVRFNCWCSAVSVMGALSTLPRADIEEMMSDGEALEISCDYCGHEYKVALEQLRGLLKSN